MIEQGALVDCLSGVTGEDLEDIVLFLRRHQLDGVRALVSLTGRDEMRTHFRDLKLLERIYPDIEDILGDHAKLVEFVMQAYQGIAPFLKRKLGNVFDDEAWVKKCLVSSDRFLEARIQEAHLIEAGKRPKPSYRMPQFSDFMEVQRPANADSAYLSFDTIVQTIAVDLANEFSAEEVRGLLHELPEALSMQLIPYLQPDVPGDAKEDLRELYENIQFEHYDLNAQMAPREIARLHQWVPRGKPVLDVGCGTGRLLLPLARLGFDIHGLDLTDRHVQYVQAELAANGQNPNRVRQGDWLATTYPDKSFVTVSCLGRNILHEYRIERQRQFFAEMNRILQEGGELILDIPDRTVAGSHYQRLAEGYREAMQIRGIHNIRVGTIFDSPDNKHFATRYSYTDLDVRRLARDAGFDIVMVEHEDLPTGQGDKNIYYRLRKVRDVISTALSKKVA